MIFEGCLDSNPECCRSKLARYRLSHPSPWRLSHPSPRTVIAHYALNGQKRSKAHTALTAPLVLHHTRIYKRAMKKIIFNGQMQNKHFLIVIYHSSLVKGAMNAARICKLRNGVKKMPQFLLFFNGQRWTKCAVNILRSYLNWWHNWLLKNRRRSHTLKGSHSMGDGRIFLKNRRDASFNKDLSNEPNFDQIHLAGQYL